MIKYLGFVRLCYYLLNTKHNESDIRYGRIFIIFKNLSMVVHIVKVRCLEFGVVG